MHKILPQASIFQDENLNRKFLEKGYFTFPLISEQQCRELQIRLSANELRQEGAFRFSIKSQDIAYKQAILDILIDFFTDKVQSLTSAYQLSRAVYLEKDTGENSHVAMHTDDCSCDETQFVPFHIWIPLVDTNKENGCICVVKGSHLATNIIRGIQIPQHYQQHHQKLFGDYLTPLENKAGEALIYHPALLHYSYPNLSNSMRPAVVAAFIPHAARPIVYYKRNKWLDKSVLEFEMTPEQYCYWNEKEEPATSLIRKIKMSAELDQSPDFLNTIDHANR